MKERRKAYREGLETGILTNFAWTSRSRSCQPEGKLKKVASAFDDFEDDEWSTEEELEEDCNGMSKGAVVRGKRLQVMEDMPVCNDKDMAGRLQNLKNESLSVMFFYSLKYAFSRLGIQRRMCQ